MTKILFDIEYIYHLATMDPVIAAFAGDDKFDIALSLGKELYRKWGLFKVSKKDDFIPYLNLDHVRWAEARVLRMFYIATCVAIPIRNT